MERTTVTTLFKSRGARLWNSDRDTGWYIFRSEDDLLEARELIPFLNLYQGDFGGGQMLIVYFDRFR